MINVGPYISKNGVEKQGLKPQAQVNWNLGTEALYEETIRRGDGVMAEGGALVVRTGQHTGRSANDKFLVKEPSSDSNIWWGAVNRPISEAQFDGLHQKIQAYLDSKELFVQDLWAGAQEDYRLPVRVITESPWHSLFIRNLLILPGHEHLAGFDPEYVILHAPNFFADPAVDGTRSETVITAHFGKKIVLIAGTSYAGEIKKSVFTILNYILPAKGVMPMHCSANIGKDGDTAIFFGLSGTGKTTLSADPSRTLIGDDEHGWSDNAVFNFEGGCYAKMIRLSAEAEPEIYATTKRFGTVLENVVMDPDTRILDLDDSQHTENTRGAYPIEFIPNTSETGIGAPPKNIIMLTADAFGVLPPIAKLTPEQAMYHFLSGYTAKVAGTEKGLGAEPQATFSTCFGAPFMSRHPSVYGNLLREKIAKQHVNCWLVNTGWTGGVYGVGSRMPIKATRALLAAALDGSLASVPMRTDENFGFEVPVSVPGVDSKILNPRDTWADAAAYDKKAQELVGLFIENFKEFADYVDDAVRAAAPSAA
ncbi:phosphoenolpyruvate carboxykinase [Govanella unica]|uniref:Phosphoenolpyruvate carboxykinase (ATP) n=1 Tax=Govanella unica TaxID=2975056 RepID=A0A9X3TZC3_9PROT|nr:phosphoenolpyruvate carboxykinase [Govania unica]